MSEIRSSLGWSDVNDLCVIEVSGRDAASFMQGRTTNDVKKLNDGQGHSTSITDRKAHILAVFSLHRLGDKFYVIASKDQSKAILEQLDTYRFREQVDFVDVTNQYKIHCVQGPLSDSLILSGQEKPVALPSEQYSIFSSVLWKNDVILVRYSTTGESGFLILSRDDFADTFDDRLQDELKERNAVIITNHEAEILRIEAGILKFGVDIVGANILPETGLEQTSVSYDKGCFPGQEVLARIKTYGAPKQAVVGLIFEEPTNGFAFDTHFQISNLYGGTIKSSCQSSTLGKYIAIAFIAREHRVPDRKLTISIDGKSYEVTVSLLPFVHGTDVRERAKQLYNAALPEFTAGSEEKAVQMLRQALQLDPLFGDAYESLGVMLARHGQHQEAIALMKKLEALDPDSIMAHANLSMFYMELGDKDKAEEEKAIALGIQMSKVAREFAAKQKQDEDKVKKLEEARNRMSMFQQVLQIDQNDLLANYGLGDANVQLGNFAEAIPYLRKALEIKPSYTVAYLALGKALENSDQSSEAMKVYEQGIEVAARKGDFSPMNDMKLRVMALKSKSAV